jgi:tRNA-Thr(GGU) m(6)t(6)A37 methyltransferase TsaA
MSESISFSPIGVVKSNFDSNTPAETIRSQPAQIVVKPEFEDGLMGLDTGTDILVLFYFDQIQVDQVKLQLHPRHNPDNPLRGVFSTRSQFRPNPVGMSVARVELIEKNVVTVMGLDALNNTPVLDIKPYTVYFDADTRSQQFEKREVHSIDETRAAIDLIDTEVIRLLGNRANFVHQIMKFKNNAEEVRAPHRYAEVIQHRRELAEQAGLNPDVIEEMYKLLVDNFIKEEMEILLRRNKATNS